MPRNNANACHPQFREWHFLCFPSKSQRLSPGEKPFGCSALRGLLNREIEEAVVTFAMDYTDAIIAYVSEKIHDWDTREMIAKIETEVGGDLHMIRVNGVVVGALIGLLLGSGRALVEHLPF